MTIKHPKRYDDQLKQQAIEMALEGSKTIAQIARDLDIKDNTLYGWVDKYRRANKEKGAIQPAMTKPVDLEAENRRLKREHKLEVSRLRIIERMKALGLNVATRQRYRNRNVAHIDDGRIGANALKRQFDVKGPNQKWVADISYIRTLEGWQYLAVFIDLYSRRVVGWAMDNRMDAQLVKRALLRALWNRKPTRGLIIHTDQGSQFVSKAFLPA
ncbi:IS3 family transposase [Thiomicrospira sp. R3]|uniref:IS3 family transposase n=1 Tax=Thiomicrospira sp. R3 TaxID=3035472 RepID=UPI00259B96EC|nr:IS3 family transposase [Thiomicrospira sp. R3]WFE68117.1 IS3 family transposase [Thiomicrospira sp. R3]WFE68183.1 IS3 family transposase [Thiomicrospira sp. R3]